jgi:hypothetical protein
MKKDLRNDAPFSVRPGAEQCNRRAECRSRNRSKGMNAAGAGVDETGSGFGGNGAGRGACGRWSCCGGIPRIFLCGNVFNFGASDPGVKLLTCPKPVSIIALGVFTSSTVSQALHENKLGKAWYAWPSPGRRLYYICSSSTLTWGCHVRACPFSRRSGSCSVRCPSKLASSRNIIGGIGIPKLEVVRPWVQ